MSGLPLRLNAVVAKETDVPAPSVEVPFTVRFPETVRFLYDFHLDCFEFSLLLEETL